MATETINTYLKNRFQYHAGSRVATETKEAFAQAMNPDGHTVTSSKIWASPMSDFPKNTGDNKTSSDGIATTNDLVAVFKEGLSDSGTASGTGHHITKTALDKGGYKWTNDGYPAVVLYEQAVMSGVQYSDGPESGGGKFQAYEVLDGGVRVKDWVAPTAVEDNGNPIPGFSGIVEVKKSSGNWTIIQQVSDGSYQWALANSRWEFVYGAGMLTFEPTFTPVGKNWPNVRITAFAYVGDYLTDVLSGMSTDTANNMMAIKPFTFSAYSMQPVSTMGGETDTSGNSLQKTIPGIVLNVFNNDTGIAYGDISFDASTGTSLFYIEDGKLEDSGIDTGMNGTTFTAYAFVLATGSPITVLPAQQLQ